MTRWKKILITFTFLSLLLTIGSAIYSNYFIYYPILEKNSYHPQYVIDTVFNDNKEPNTNIENASPKENAVEPAITEKNHQPPIISPMNPTITESNNSSALPNKEIANTIEQKVGELIEPADLLQAVSIILRKLSEDEISFLLGFSDKKYTVEEFMEIRKLLLNKLSIEDITILRALAQKYDKKLEILDPDVPIE